MKLLILICIFTLFHKIRTVCLGSTPYSYTGNCYAQCPWNPPSVTYLYTIDNTCRTICPGPSYFADDSTKSCVQTCPNYPIITYYDLNRFKCVQTCSSNPSQFALQSNRSCLALCPSPLYADDATRLCVNTCPTNKLYQIVGTLRVCTTRCYPNFYSDQSNNCVLASSCPISPVKYYGDDLSGLCVKSCSQNSSTYAQQSSRKCVQHCTLGTYADPTTLRCVTKCPLIPAYYGSNTTRMCQLQCVQGQFSYEIDRQCYKVCPAGYGDYSTRKCVQKCPQTNSTFADPQTKLCIQTCSPGYYADNATRACVTSVDCTQNLVGNPLTLQCIDGQDCPVGYFIDYNSFICVKKCINGEFANQDTRICGTQCPWNPPIYITFKQSESRKCLQQCPYNPRTFSDNTTQSCVNQCDAGQFGSTANYDCVQTCPDGFYGDSQSHLCLSTCTTNTSVILYFYYVNTSCITGCPEGTYADNTTLTCVLVCPSYMFANQNTNQCLQQCPDTLFGDSFSGKCVDKCPAITKQYADDSTNLCVDICPLDTDYFGQDINDGNRKCVSSCTLTDVYADPITRTCVKKCNYTDGYFGQPLTGRCVLKCSTGYGNPITNLCTATCPESPIQTFGDNLTSTCVYKCPNNSYGDKTTDVCMKATDCPATTYGDDFTNLCVSKCPSLLSTYGDPVTKKCVKSCQYNYYTDNTTRLCTQTCNATAKLYKDPSTRKCVLNCPSIPDLYNDPASMTCVSNCTDVNYPYRYNYLNIRKCVAMCPASPVYFADEQTKTCVLRCANLTFKFVNNTYRGCLSTCPLQVYNTTKNLTLYEDNVTWTCVSVCPPGYYAFKHPSNDSIRKCLQTCQIADNITYFADDVTRSCVAECPTKIHNTYGDEINFKCVKTCTRKQYRDVTTKRCVYNCPKLPIPYFADNSTWNCSKKCPVGTFAQSVNNTCVKQCPKDKFGYKQQCVDACPAGTTVFQDNTTWFCVDKCTTLPDYYSDPLTQSCVKNCTPGTFADSVSRSCVAALQCPGDQVADPLTYRCVDQCSKVPMYFVMPATNLCGLVCINGLFAFNDTNQCIDACPTPYFGVNTSANFYCKQYCPNSQLKYIEPVTNFRICLTGCPDGFFAFYPKMQCVTLCPDGYFGKESTNQCVTGCSPQFSDDTTNMCVSTCPDGSTADTNIYTCKGKCKYGQFMENKICKTSCSPGSFADNLTRSCISNCPSDPFTFADPFVKKCVFTCSLTYYGYFDNRTCLNSCPVGLFKQQTLRLCISPCLQDQYGDPDSLSCVTSCSASTYLFADPTSQKCTKVCSSNPDLYGYANKCIDHCPLGKFAQNFTRTCVDICPNISAIYLNESFADDLTRRCVQRCSALSFAHKSNTSNVCLNQCPNGFFASQILQACVLICPQTTYALNGSKQCVTKCPNGQWGDTFTKTCMDGCHYNNQFSDNSTNMCVDKCPEQPDMYGKASTKQCVLYCDTSFYAHPVSRLCQAACQSPYYADPSSQICVLTCPTHELQYADDHLRSCVHSCTNYTVSATSTIIEYADKTSKKCVASCPQIPQVLYGFNTTNTCEQYCPSGTFADNDTRLCLDKCIFKSPKFNWMDRLNNLCVEICPLGYFSDNTTKGCQLTCSTGTFADNSTRKCVTDCPVNPSLFSALDDLNNRVCSYTCKIGLYADQITRSCIARCPTQPFYYFHASQKRSCQKQCQYPYFGQVQSQNCVQSCRQGFYGNLTTKKCQACRTQCVTCSAYLQCLTCTVGFFLFEFQCVTSCPSYPILYFSLDNSATCFKKCPQPYFGLQSTKKCQISCPVSYYPNLDTRLCTVCPSGCLSCQMAGCITCYDGFTYVANTRTCNAHCNSTDIYYFNSQCFESCPDGSFLTRDLVHCQACYKQCAICVGTAANCTKCAQKFYYQGVCVDACPSDYFVNENMACISCKIVPDRCLLSPLTYKISPFTQNYQQKAYVVFSRSVDMTLDQFISTVQIYINGRAVKSNEFTAKVYNATSYVVTFDQSISLNQQSLVINTDQFLVLKSLDQSRLGIQYPTIQQDQQNIYPQDVSINNQIIIVIQSNSQQNIAIKQNKKIAASQFNPQDLFSLNQNSLSIGFKPGTIKDMYGNILTINKLQQQFESKTGVTQETVTTSTKVQNSTETFTWILLAVILIFLLKGGYPVLICLQVAQMIYMHTFLYANPMPYLQLKFLQAFKNFHFLFFPKIAQLGVKGKAYEDIVPDVSFFANCGPLIFVWLIVGLLYLTFTILSSKKLIKSKAIRHFAKKIKKTRIRYQLIHDGFWLTFLYAIFFAMYQLKSFSFESSMMIGNFVFAIAIIIVYTLFTIYLIRLGNRFKGKKIEQIPKKWRFIIPQPSSFPMQLPLRFLRKLLLCVALVMPAFQAQVIIMLMVNFVFLCYYMCFMPASSKVTNYLNFIIEIGYIIIQGLFYGYFKLQYKTIDQQAGFAITLISVEAFIMFIVFVWMIYRFIEVMQSSDAWKYVYMKLTQNRDPQYLKQQQRKRDLQFDFGSLQNRSQNEISDDLNISSKNLNLKKQNISRNTVFFEKETKATNKRKEKKIKQKKVSSSSQISISNSKSIEQEKLVQNQLMNQKILNENVHVLKSKETRIKSPFLGKRGNFLKIDDDKDIHELQQIVIKHDNQLISSQIQIKQEKGIWDDIEFDQHQI